MSRPVVESVRIVVRSEDGGARLEVNGKGSATEGMHTAFLCMSEDRRAAFLRRLQSTHAELVANAKEPS